MRPLALAVAIVGLSSVAAALLFYGRPGEPTPPAILALPEPDAALAPAAPPERQRARPVTPDIAAFPVEPDTLERIDAREPLGPVGRAPDPSELPPGETILHRPVALAAGLFEAQGHRVALAGIVPTDTGESCAGASTSWPCGVHARTAFRNWLRGRALTCVVTRVPDPEVVRSDCSLGTQNPAEWLVTQGWARAEPGGPYTALEEEAQAQGRGIFGRGPSGG